MPRAPRLRRQLRRVHLSAVAGLLVVAAGVGVSACGSSSSGSAKSGVQNASKSLVPFTFRTDYAPGGTYAYLQYGIDQGYYAKQGLDFKLQYGNGSVLTANDIAAGRTDAGDTNSAVAALSIGKGAKIVSVGAWTSKYEFGIYVPKSTGITTLNQLKGKTVIVSPGSEEAELFPGVLKRAGMSTSDVHILSISAADELTAYEHGQGDAIAESYPYANALVQPQRPSNFVAFASAGLTIPNYSYIVNKAFLAKNSTLVAKFLRATYQSLAGAFAHPQAAAADFVKANPTMKVADVLATFKADQAFVCTPAMRKNGEPVGFQNTRDWADGVALMHKYLSLPAQVTVSDVITNKFFGAPYKVSSQKC